MSTDKIRLPGVSDDEDRLLNRLLKQLSDKSSRNVLRASYYDGKRAIQQVGTVIPPQYTRLGIVLGWSAKAVDILARRCNLDGFVWADGDLDSLGAQEVWDDNHLGAEINSLLVSSLIHSTAFLVNTEGGDNEPASLISVKDALNATGDWNVRARRLDNLLSITAREENQPTGLALYLDGETLTATKENGKWTVERQFHPWGVPAEAVAYKPRVGRPFGSSRISRPVMSIHDQALRTIIRLEGHADVFSYPEMWMLGADPSIFRNADGTVQPQWQVMLGRIKGIPDDDEAENPRADIKQFQAASPTPHIETLKLQAQLFSGETSIPVSSLGDFGDIANPTSADSYIASREDLIAEAEGATDDWAPPLRRSMIRALAIQNGLNEIPAEWKSIDTKWRSPVHLSRAAVADAGMKQLAAVPWLAETEVGLELLGLNEQQIDRAMSEKRRTSGREVMQTIQQTLQQKIAAATEQPPVINNAAIGQTEDVADAR
ncbi:phage portal protein [Mycolicibacterium conceptionense]|nr:phage portal protein [Mycolicibacterium conceptionense]